MAVVNQQLEDDYNHGLAGSRSSIDGLARVSTSTEKIGNRASTSRSQVLQLKFMNGISTTVSTRKNIEGKDHKPLVVALIDQISGLIVTTGAEASTEVEIVVLEGDFNDVEAENWNSGEFNNKILREWNGTKKLLQGKTLVKLKEGIVYVNNISFTHNSRWKGKRNCRLGARSVGGVFATRVKEAITQSFLVMDNRNLKYNKHPIPLSFDDVYRLYKINRRSDRFRRLKAASINTVMDLRALNAINPERLKDILKVHPNEWKIIMDHAHKCKDVKGIYLYPNLRDDQKRDGVVFNVSGHLVGVVADSQFIPCVMLSNNKKGDAEKVIVSASEDWKKVVPFKDEASLINHLHSGISVPNGINLVNPQTNHLNTPTNNKLKLNIIVEATLPTGPLSQSPKRPASEHDDISNSPKKPRDNHQKISLITPNAGTSRMTNTSATSEEVIDDDDEEYLKYLNLSDSQKWESVWCVVGWISILYSRVQSRRQLLQTSDDDTIMAITTSVEHVQI